MPLDVGTEASHAIPNLPLQQDFAEWLSRQLPDDALQLQIKKRSQNFGRIQAGAFHNIINVHRLLGAEQLEELFLRAIQCSGGQSISLLALKPLGLRGAQDSPQDGIAPMPPEDSKGSAV